jgi:hypothetical protein
VRPRALLHVAGRRGVGGGGDGGGGGPRIRGGVGPPFDTGMGGMGRSNRLATN